MSEAMSELLAAAEEMVRALRRPHVSYIGETHAAEAYGLDDEYRWLSEAVERAKEAQNGA